MSSVILLYLVIRGGITNKFCIFTSFELFLISPTDFCLEFDKVGFLMGQIIDRMHIRRIVSHSGVIS
jgi:hypothetical protein